MNEACIFSSNLIMAKKYPDTYSVLNKHLEACSLCQKEVERINEILRSDSMLAKLEDKAKNNIQMMLLGNSKSVQEIKKQQE